MLSQKISASALGALLALASFALFSTHDVIIKNLGGTYSPIQVMFITSLLSFPILTLVLMRDPNPETLLPKHPYWIIFRSCIGVISALSAFYAVTHLPLSQFYAFLFASPLIITLLAIPMLGETVGLRRGIAVICGLIGVMIVLRPGSSAFTGGHIAAIIAACAGALVSIITRKISADERRVVMILYPMMINLIVTGLVLPFVYVQIPLADLGLFAIDTLLVLVAMWFLVTAYQKAPAVIVAPMQYSQMIWATIFGILLFSEYPDWPTYVGTGVIVLAGAYILRREASGGSSKNQPVLETRTRGGHAITVRVGQLLGLRRKHSKD
ncbi:DMT family transporter [Akkermansiaceae bacterium]|nr:DMT family transporter [Akkermansiaceae bacterium]